MQYENLASCEVLALDQGPVNEMKVFKSSSLSNADLAAIHAELHNEKDRGHRFGLASCPRMYLGSSYEVAFL